MKPATLIVMGRSPRVRGSLRCPLAMPLTAGSIPAGAGEPSRAICRSNGLRVDPRGCGGAYGRARDADGLRGRSPRVRGSRSVMKAFISAPGSIPAGAGEPRPRRCSRCERRVDPRGCGGAVASKASPSSKLGRSPRVRGSHLLVLGEVLHVGSIPAGAGEPQGSARVAVAGRVDPRGCGGARQYRRRGDQCRGRSPRVRGSLTRRGGGQIGRGSIPAGAGEPDRR